MLINQSVLIILIIIVTSCEKTSKNNDPLNLQSQLEGSWVSSAWTGELHEEWVLGSDGWMIQQGYYIENGDTSFSARTKIEQVDNQLILFSVIRDSNPKIFKEAIRSKSGFIVENKEYKNPFKVEYEFIDDNNYKRTITGFEQDSLVSTVFNFIKQK